MNAPTLKTNEWLRQRQVDELLKYLRKRTARKGATRRDHSRRLIIELGLFAGLRASEIVGLNIKHLPMYHGALSLQVAKGKRGKPREVPVSTELAKLIWHYVVEIRKLVRPIPAAIEPLIWGYLAGDEATMAAMTDKQKRGIGAYLADVRAAGPAVIDAPLFVDKNSNRLGRHTAWSGTSIVGQALGYEKPNGPRPENSVLNTLYPHRMRHTCAMRMAINKVHISEIKQFLGHSDINITMRYLLTSQLQMSETAQKQYC